MSVQLERLMATLTGIDKLLILPHNNPDPDAIASAVALRHLLAEKLGVISQIFYKGIIGRAENRALVRYLGHPLQRLTTSTLAADVPIALVDTQPGAGNNPLPLDLNAAIVIDHHPQREASPAAGFSDIRPHLGSTSSILVEYFKSARLKITPALATALFYGIKTDTLGLERGVSSTDMQSFCRLLPRIDVEALFRIEQAQVPSDYFNTFALALQNARWYDNVIVSYLGMMDYPDLVAEMADLFLRVRGCRWVICLGVYQDSLIISVRTYNKRGAGQLVQSVVGEHGTAGGHGAMAGGQVPLQGGNPHQMAAHFSQQMLRQLKVPSGTPGKPLISMLP